MVYKCKFKILCKYSTVKPHRLKEFNNFQNHTFDR